MRPLAITSRRTFLGSAGLLGTVYRAAATPVSAAISREIRRRAEKYLGLRYLVVDYYRIRRRLAYPLPVQSLSIPAVPVPTIADYPWSIWMLWELEERVHSLGWAAEWFKNEEFARSAVRDLEALTAWPKYCQLRQPDLASAHAGRLLWAASTSWRFLNATLRQKIRAACTRHVEELLPFVNAYYGPLQSKQDVLALAQPHIKLANIPLIGTVGAALTARIAAHSALPALDRRVRMVMGAILDLRASGHTEAVGYDGYILDFIADWLRAVPAEERKEILHHPRLQDYLEESYLLSAPGAMEQVAALSDVEPKEMPFHYSAQAKLAHLQKDPVQTWYLSRWPLDWIRADALAALGSLPSDRHNTPPAAGARNAHYAAVLRTGWEKDDLAVAMSCPTSRMGHLQSDSGTVVIGTRGRWIVCDPGYQQYMKDSERDFTVGPAAHNCPVINGIAQDKKEPRLLLLEQAGPNLLRAKVELATCYPREAAIQSVVRSLWQVGRLGVVIADRIVAAQVKTLTYHWHGHPDAAWACRDGWMLLHLPDADLWFNSPQSLLAEQDIRRLPGSRGQLTLVAQADPARSIIWWAFAVSAAMPHIESLDGGSAIRFLGARLQVT